MNVIDELFQGFIVSCQAEENSPLDESLILSGMAAAAVKGGAIGIRANMPRNIRSIKKRTGALVIGIYKKKYKNSSVYITPTFHEAKEVIDAGADMIAIDCTDRERPEENLETLIKKIRSYSDVPILADIATFKEAKNAYNLGVEAVATTLLSYTKKTENESAPDFNLVQELSNEMPIPVFVEGHIRSPEQAFQAIQAGAYAVVVGTAITSISWSTSQYVRAIKN